MSFYNLLFSQEAGPAIFTYSECRYALTLSIIASRSCLKDLGFIDLFLVRNDNDTTLSNMVIQEHTLPKANSTVLQGGNPRHREILVQHRLGQTPMKTTPTSSGTGAPTRSRTLTIVLEATWANSFAIQLVPRPPEQQRESSRHRDRLAIVYKRRLALEPHRHAFYMTLESSIPIILNTAIFDYEAAIRETRRRSKVHSPPSNIPSMLYSVSVVSDEKVSSVHFSSPPLTVLRAIALFAIEFEHPRPHWRRQLFILGMINKSWSKVLDLFFEIHCEPQTKDKRWPIGPVPGGEYRSSIMSLARALFAARPQRALLMRKFCLSNYHEALALSTKGPILAATRVILYSARNLRHIDLPVEFLCEPDVIQLLGFTQLETAIIQPHYEMGKNLFIGVPILHIMFWWPDLVVFAAKGPGYIILDRNLNNGGELQLATIATSQDTELPCNLKQLDLRAWSIDSTIFFKFFNPMNPRMEHLSLSFVSGFTNRDLYRVLESGADLLITIRIVKCGIRKEEDEEHAIDALISRFSSLEMLIASPEHLTYRALENRSMQAVKYPVRLTISHLTEAASFLRNFPAALQRASAAWENITIQSSTQLSKEDRRAIRLTEAAGRAIGLDVLHIDDYIDIGAFNYGL